MTNHPGDPNQVPEEQRRGGGITAMVVVALVAVIAVGLFAIIWIGPWTGEDESDPSLPGFQDEPTQAAEDEREEPNPNPDATGAQELEGAMVLVPVTAMDGRQQQEPGSSA